MKNKPIVIFTSREEMDAARYREAADMDPVEGLRKTVELILRAYGTTREELNQRPRDTKITFVHTS